MSVKRKDIGFTLLREGGNHSIYTNGEKTIPLKRHIANKWKSAGDSLDI